MNANHMTIGFIGLGHIGGSVAKTVHRIYPDIQIVAYDTCRATLDTALQEGVITLLKQLKKMVL